MESCSILVSRKCEWFICFKCFGVIGGKIGPARWASPVRPKLGPGWAIKLLARKKPGQIWPGPVWPSPVWPGPARLARIFFCLEKTIWPDRPDF